MKPTCTIVTNAKCNAYFLHRRSSNGLRRIQFITIRVALSWYFRILSGSVIDVMIFVSNITSFISIIITDRLFDTRASSLSYRVSLNLYDCVENSTISGGSKCWFTIEPIAVLVSRYPAQNTAVERNGALSNGNAFPDLARSFRNCPPWQFRQQC